MVNAMVLMTAMPPTYGHLDLIQFAGNLKVDQVVVFLNTQPGEPMVEQRAYALQRALTRMGKKYRLSWQNEATVQEPEGTDDEAFWADWVGNIKKYGFNEGDYIVASEPYGFELAKRAGGVFMPYDRDRWVRYTKGTASRNNHIRTWEQIIPEFRKFLQKRVTVFGAESTGKTTLVTDLYDAYNDEEIGVTKLFEWARPYLEMTDPVVTVEAMHRIHEGQYALQEATYENVLQPLVLQDTDLWTTVGFWEDWDPDSVPDDITVDAFNTQSDLYLITTSNIPFEHDLLRYGGDERQTNDQYWIDLCEKYQLPYVVIESADRIDRINEAMDAIAPLLESPLKYKRIGAEYV